MRAYVPFPAACTRGTDAEWVGATAIALVVRKKRRILQASKKSNKNNVFRFEQKASSDSMIVKSFRIYVIWVH